MVKLQALNDSFLAENIVMKYTGVEIGKGEWCDIVTASYYRNKYHHVTNSRTRDRSRYFRALSLPRLNDTLKTQRTALDANDDNEHHLSTIMNRNTTVPSTPRVSRPPPFTPKRPLSIQSTPSSSNDTSVAARLSRTNSNSSTSSSLSTPQTLLSTTHKKYKAPLSVESRSKTTYGKTKPVLPTVPGTPTKKDGTQSRPRTPNTPRRGAESPSLMPAAGEMDVSNVDPERVLVDYQTVEPGDVSGEIDEAWLRAAELDHGKQDKVMVSIRSGLLISSCNLN